jgi:hypothetical protein
MESELADRRRRRKEGRVGKIRKEGKKRGREKGKVRKMRKDERMTMRRKK